IAGQAASIVDTTVFASESAGQDDVGCAFAMLCLSGLETEIWQVDIAIEMFSFAEHHGRYHEMHFVDLPGEQILPDRGGASSDSDVFPVRRFECALQRDFRAFCDEVEGRPAFHDERFAGVVRQYENRNTIRWRVAPPAFPGIIRPGTANRSEHVAAE